MKCKVFLTDEGFGPLVRFAALLHHLRLRIPGLEVEVQTYNHVELFPSLADCVSIVKRHNLIRWHRHADGRPDVEAIRACFAHYEVASRQFVDEHLALPTRPDFIISDFVYEAFEVGARQGVPCFGLAHFTWDWFFGKMYPNPIPPAVVARWKAQADSATRLFFPAFTPDDIIDHHPNASLVPLVVRPMGMTNAPRVPHGHFKVLIVDSGSRVLQEDLRKALRPPRPVTNRTFFIREGMLDSVADDVITVPADQKLIDLIPHMDLVIGRAGFNTISECLAARIPMLLLGEAMNPEMAANIIAMKSRNLASFVDIKSLATDFVGTLESFLAGEFRTIRERVSTHSIGLDGAEVVANEIADLIGLNSNA